MAAQYGPVELPARLPVIGSARQYQPDDLGDEALDDEAPEAQPGESGNDGGGPADQPAGDRAQSRGAMPELAQPQRHVRRPAGGDRQDRKSVVSGKSGSVRVDPGGRRILQKTKKNITQ